MIEKSRNIPKFSTQETASYESSPFGSSRVSSWVNLGGEVIIQPEDDLLLRRGGVEALHIYKEVLYDHSVQSAFKKLVQEITARDIRISPFSDSPEDEEIAEFVGEALKDLPMDAIYSGLAESLIVGVGYGEVLWHQKDGKTTPYDVRIRDQRRFLFTKMSHKKPLVNVKSFYGLRVRNSISDYPGKQVPLRKFIVSRSYITNSSDPYGRGLGRILYPLIQFSRRALESYLLFTDRFATPTAVGEVPPTATEEEANQFFDHIKNLSQEMALVLPPGFSLKFESPAQGNPDMFMNLIDHIDGVINLLIVGENESGMAEAGSYASSEVANLISSTRSQELSQSISTDLRNSLVKWIVELNFGIEKNIPYLERTFNLTKSNLTVTDLSTIKEKFGYQPSKSWIEHQFNIELEDVPEEKDVDISGLL